MIDQRLKQLMERLKTTPFQFAKDLGYVRADKLYKVLNGEAKPSYETIEDIAKALPELNLNWLIRGEGDMFQDVNLGDETLRQLISADIYKLNDKQEIINLLTNEVARIKSKS